MNKISIGGFTRISKAAARKLYNENKAIYLCAVNINPTFGAIKAARETWYKTIVNDGFVSVVPRNDSFDCLCNAFSFYNCINSETGKYIAFYVKEK